MLQAAMQQSKEDDLGGGGGGGEVYTKSVHITVASSKHIPDVCPC